MIQFNLPNYSCRLSPERMDATGNTVIDDKNKFLGYCYAESPEDAEALLKKYTSVPIHVHKVEQCNFESEWKKKVENKRKEVAEAIAGNKNPSFPAVWSDLKEHLIVLFHGKCGYCEAQFISVSFGDVEHFRPKGRVDEDKNHKGYYWLAYEPTNYLPACQICNEAIKRDHFPIEGIRAYSEADPLEDEKPLLINPYRDAFEDHLEFFPSTHPERKEPGMPAEFPGGVKGKTLKGGHSISALGLYRSCICDHRLREMLYALKDIKDAYRKLADSNLDKPAWDEFTRSLQMFLSEERPFRTAAYYEMREYLRKLRWPEEDIKEMFVSLGFHA